MIVTLGVKPRDKKRHQSPSSNPEGVESFSEGIKLLLPQDSIGLIEGSLKTALKWSKSEDLNHHRLGSLKGFNDSNPGCQPRDKKSH